MKSNNMMKGFLIIALVVVGGIGYYNFQRSGSLIGSGSTAGAYIGQTFPPILFFDSKPSFDNGCYDLKWSSLNVTSCTSNWRPTVATNGGETVCQGRKDVNGNRVVEPNVGGISYSITCSGPAGNVSRTINVK